MKDLGTLLNQARNYESFKQWDNAALLYAKILDGLYEESGPAMEVAKPGRTEVEAAVERLASQGEGRILPIGRLPEPLRALGSEISGKFSTFDFKKVKYFSVFQQIFNRRWTLVFLKKKSTIKYEKLRLDLPQGTTDAFVLDFAPPKQKGTGTGFETFTVRQPQADLLAYCWAHLGEARVTSAINLYVFSKVLVLTGFPLITQEIRFLRYALLLKPDYGWAWAHLGEAYRNLGNGWWPTVNEMLQPEKRIDCYIKALVYLHKATQQEPNDYWNKAHLGATICNVRSFVPDNACEIPALQALIDAWLGRRKNPGGTEAQYELLFTEYAIENLVEAQNLAGEYYPWAQAYQGVAMYIKAFLVLERDPAQALDLTQNALAFSIDSYVLCPQLITDSIEPGEIYNNPFISLSLLCLYLKDFDKAWSYALLTLSRSFDNPFIPGLAAVIVFHQLISISYDAILNGQEGDECPASQDPIGVFENLPKQPICNKAQLAHFILLTFKDVVVPTVAPFLDKSVRLDTKIAMGLMSVVFLLFNAIQAYEFASGVEPGSDAAAQKMEEFLRLLCARLGIQDPYRDACFGDLWTSDLRKAFMFSLLNFKNLSYASLSLLKSA